ncbi:hypothetical protein Tco_0769479 [Tanacetum coccineum]|uniref:Reverse transcriptase domain-containing protein n=1 Tax=Tanacetum coccineum TaxID=301880 RepID=A0ABQ4ZDE1_9ASTR
MIQPEPEDLPKDNPKLEIAVLSSQAVNKSPTQYPCDIFQNINSDDTFSIPQMTNGNPSSVIIKQHCGPGTLPSNTITNRRGRFEGYYTRSGLLIKSPPISYNYFSPPKVVERDPSGNPTLYYDSIVSTSSPTLTPFGNSDSLLKEVDGFLALEDDPTSSEVDDSYYDSEGDILLLMKSISMMIHHYHPPTQEIISWKNSKRTKSTFQRCMMAIFHDMIEKKMEVFLDNFSVFGNSFRNCLSRVDKMLQRCEDTDLCLNWEMSHFMVKEDIVLGHKISKNRIEVDKAKVDVIAKLPHPTIIKGVQSFLGHAGFY